MLKSIYFPNNFDYFFVRFYLVQEFWIYFFIRFYLVEEFWIMTNFLQKRG